MESTEKRRVNKLLRKPSSSVGKTLGLRQKLSRNAQKQVKFLPVATEKATKQEISVDVATLCAEMCGVSDLSQSGANLLQKHLNQIARLLIHQILRVMEQSRRGTPQASDIDLASVLIGLENPFGTSTANFLPVRTGGRTASSGPGGKVFFIRPDKEIDVKALILREPAGVVYDVSLVAHWLSVNGKQPTSPQNPPPDFLSRMALLNNSFGSNKQNNKRMGVNSDNNDDGDASNEKQSKTSSQNNGEKTDTDSTSSSHPRKVLALSVERRPHEISQEVMIYFREITEACVGANETRRHEALENATLDPGLQPLLPHLMTFITEGVRINVTNHNLAILIYLMRLVKALIDNPHISLEPYLHLLVPTVITCVLNRQLCAKPLTDNHWALRDFAAKQLITLCNRHNTSSNELYSRVTRELSRALCSWIDGNASTNSTDTCMKLSSVSVSNEKNETIKTPDDGKLSGMKLCKYDPVDRTIHLVNSSGTTTSSINSSSSSSGGVGGGIVGSSGSTSGNTVNGPSLGGAVHSMNTLYGILVALAEFGPQCLRVIVFPLLSSLCQRLTKITESDPSSVNNTNESNTPGSVDNDMIKSKQQQQHPVLSLNLGCKLSPVDQRSFDSLKALMTNRFASVLNDWRLRQGLGVKLEDYRSAYGCLADCLFITNQNNNSNSLHTYTTTNTTTITTTTSAVAAANTNTTNNNVTTTHGSITSSKPPQQSSANMNIITSSINSSSNNNNNSTPVTLNTSTTSNSVTNPSSSSGRIIVTSHIVPSNVNTSNA